MRDQYPEQRLRIRNENVKWWGSSTVPSCGYVGDLILFMILNHMLLEDEYPDTIISLHNVPLQNYN